VENVFHIIAKANVFVNNTVPTGRRIQFFLGQLKRFFCANANRDFSDQISLSFTLTSPPNYVQPGKR
jgi:hypothetical protein